MSVSGRAAARAIWEAALAAGNVDPIVRRVLRRDGDVITAGPLAVDLKTVRRLLVLGAGKASAAMAQAVEDLLDNRISDGLVVVKDGYARATRTVRIVEASHPVPDERGQAAARELRHLAESATRDDLVIFLISGGGSALLPAPAPPVTLAEKRELTTLLLAAGASIGELNAVRKHLSLLKGGQLARAAVPAPVLTLALSDVIGNAMDVIASGPTAPDPSTYAQALEIIDRFKLRERALLRIVGRLEAGARGAIPETPKPGDPLFARVTNLVIGDNSLVVDAAAARAAALGYEPVVLTRALEGEARDVARGFVTRGRTLTGPACLIAAGETTVTVNGGGVGGRCQEFALAAALELEGAPHVTVLAAGTDGTDGPTDAAGALADASTVARGRERRLDVHSLLESNDSHSFFRAIGDLVRTGPTGTNLLDLYLLVVDPLPAE
ncbi:MAG: glycerate kinase [Candidatus Rokuibacteriota bacterium]|nr:MAG: glycerate kinase [Candidatus Rokubacteria bacterium]